MDGLDLPSACSAAGPSAARDGALGIPTVRTYVEQCDDSLVSFR